MIVPSNHQFTRLIEYTSLHHAGPQHLTASICGRYWILRIRNLVKAVIHHQCLTCYRFKVHASQQLMGELPSARVQPSRPLVTTGIDYDGPISVWLGNIRSKTVTKGYVKISVCFVTKAVHIEIVIGLTTEAHLASLKHFIACRGKPKTIYSDKWHKFPRCIKPTT